MTRIALPVPPGVALGLAVVVLASCNDHHGGLPPNWPGTTSTSGTGSEAPGAVLPAQGSPACGKGPGKTGTLPQQVSIQGKQRRYTLVVPSDYSPGTSYPLVFVLHGHGGSGAQARSAFGLEAAAGGRAIFVYPDGVKGGWDLDSDAARNADVALFDLALARTQSDYCVDLHRVFVAGFSNGAYMANQLACRRGNRIRAVASHAGGGPYDNGGKYDDTGHLVCQGKAVASLVVHGTSDNTVTMGEGQKSIDHWTHANRCSGHAEASPRGCVAYQGCTSPVVACKVDGLGHSMWPQAKQLTWSFFDTLK